MRYAIVVSLFSLGCSKATPSKQVEPVPAKFVSPPSLSAAQAPQPSLVPAVQVTSIKEPEPVTDAWQANITTSEMDDVKTTVLRLDAENKIRGFGGIESKPELIVRCANKSLDAYVITHTPANLNFGDDGYRVKLRFDSAKPVDQEWSASEDHAALFASKPRALVEQLEKAAVFRFQFTPLVSVSEVVTFNVQGFAKHKEAIKDCLVRKPAKKTAQDDGY